MTLKQKGNQSLASLKSSLRRLPISLAQSIAGKAAPVMTELTVSAFASGRNVYDDPRPVSVNGAPLSLEQTGTTRRTLRFISNGTIVRCVLGTRYARYLIGRYQILPNGALPAGWKRRLDSIVRTEGLPP